MSVSGNSHPFPLLLFFVTKEIKFGPHLLVEAILESYKSTWTHISECFIRKVCRKNWVSGRFIWTSASFFFFFESNIWFFWVKQDFFSIISIYQTWLLLFFFGGEKEHDNIKWKRWSLTKLIEKGKEIIQAISCCFVLE